MPGWRRGIVSGKLKLAYNFRQNYNKNSESLTFYDDDAMMMMQQCGEPISWDLSTHI